MRAGLLSRQRLILAWLVAVGGSAALTALLVPLRQGDTPGIEAMLYLSLVVACALIGGLWPALGASSLGVLLLNFFFSAPFHTFNIAHQESIALLALYVVVSVAVAAVVDSAARRRLLADQAAQEASTLGMLNRTLLEGASNVNELLDLVCATFAAQRAELVDRHPAHTLSQVVVPSTKGRWLVLTDCWPSDSERRVLAAFATHLGVLREREELAAQTQAAHELEAGNRIRTALLAAVSHDLRTPLAGIKAAAGTLRLAEARLSGADRCELIAGIESSVDRLAGIVDDLLDMSRLQTGALEPVFTSVDLAGLVARVVRDLEAESRVRLPARSTWIVTDEGLLTRIVTNLLSNALRFSASLEVEFTDHEIRFIDHGPGVSAEDVERMFQPFQRLGDATSGTGLGLGLAVARGLSEALGAELHPTSTPGGGLTMVLRWVDRR